MNVNFITGMPAPYKLICFAILAKELPDFTVSFETLRSPQNGNENVVQRYGIPYSVMKPGWRAWGNWLRIGLRRDAFPIHGNYSRPGAGLAILLHILLGVRYGVWTSSRLADWRRGDRLSEFVKRLIFSRAAVVFVPGTQAQAYVRSYGARRIFVTPNCIDVAAFDAAIAEARENPVPDAPGKLKLLFVGRYSPEKDVPCLLRAIARLDPEMRKRTTLKMVGFGPQEPELGEMIQALGLDEVATIHGFKTGTDLARQYLWADVLVLPSLSEPWGLVVNEALQSGTVPIVSSRVGCVPELVHDGRTGFVFEAGDDGALAAILERLARDPSPLTAMRAEGRQLISRFTPEAFSNGLLQGLRATGLVGP